VTVETWQEVMQHAERLAKTAERKASAQRSHFMRRADRQAKSHARRSEIKRRNYERHLNVQQVRLSLHIYLA
jgi:hypothetical protein